MKATPRTANQVAKFGGPTGSNLRLVNTTIETYVQDPPSSCMSCHRVFNARGHDFVGILGRFR